MPVIPIDPSMVTSGGAWNVQGLDPSEAAKAAEGAGAQGATPGVQGAEGGGGESFGSLLGNQVKALQASQTQAAEASTALATGTATDPTSVVMSVERARMSMQMASQIRTKAVESFQDIFRTQV